MGRQISATNPESGTVSYTYDNVGNVRSRTDARGVAATYGAYDPLNRPTSISYNDGVTKTVLFGYDGVANGNGQLTSIANDNSATSFTAFDELGRVTASTQRTNNQLYSFTYSYNLAGALTSETYPSGRVMTYTYDAANRPYSLSGSLNGQGTNYVTGSGYWPATKYWTAYRNGVWKVWGSFNARLQPTWYYDW